MVVVVFKCFCVVEYRVVVFHHGFTLESVPQTISSWGNSSFADCAGSCSTSISLIHYLLARGQVSLRVASFWLLG